MLLLFSGWQQRHYGRTPQFVAAVTIISIMLLGEAVRISYLKQKFHQTESLNLHQLMAG